MNDRAMILWQLVQQGWSSEVRPVGVVWQCDGQIFADGFGTPDWLWRHARRKFRRLEDWPRGFNQIWLTARLNHRVIPANKSNHAIVSSRPFPRISSVKVLWVQTGGASPRSVQVLRNQVLPPDSFWKFARTDLLNVAEWPRGLNAIQLSFDVLPDGG
jgi:hypothetical protein